MTSNEDLNTDRPLLKFRKARDRALILPLVGSLLLLPPLADVFQLDANIGGVPFVAIYLFAAWGMLIACAAALSRQLLKGEQDTEHPANDEQE